MHASSRLRKQVTVFEYSIIKLSRIEAENADVMVEEGVAGGGGGGGGGREGNWAHRQVCK